MSGPGGSNTKRDQRREMRRAQLSQRQAERQRERQRVLRRQRIQRTALIIVPIIILLVIIAVVVFATRAPAAPAAPSGKPGTYTSPATGQVRDGIACSAGSAQHYHAYLAIYVNGQQVPVPGGAGLVDNGTTVCDYPLHVHDGENDVIHVESADQTTYTVGQFFDIWGKPLSATQVMQYKVDASHPLTVDVFDASGHMTTYTGNPWDIKIQPHETIALLYNSPGVHPAAFTGWAAGE
jgi:hypothetical protein